LVKPPYFVRMYLIRGEGFARARAVDTTHMDCPHIQRTRYPIEDYTSYDMLTSGNAALKIELAIKLIRMLEYVL